MTTDPEPSADRYAEAHATIDALLADLDRARLPRGHGITHRDGVPWYEAPLPLRWHRCRPQSWGTLSTGNFWERCACGAIRNGEGRPWIDRNSRRKEMTR